MATPYSLQVRDEVSSTQDLAAAAFKGTPLLVVAARQTQGRGRSRRSWQSAPRAMAASLVYSPAWAQVHWPLIPLVAGLSAAEVLGQNVGLKWPNDLVVEGGKVGGILVEGSTDGVVVGCGANLWWPDPPAGIAGLFENDPGGDLFVRVAEDWARRLLERVAMDPNDWGRPAYLTRCLTIGKEITWEPAGRGKAIDVDDEGALVVETPGGTTHLLAGEIRHIREARRNTEDGN